MFTIRQWKIWFTATLSFNLFLFFIFSPGFAKSPKWSISPQFIGSDENVQTIAFTFPVDGGRQNTFEISCPSSCEKLILVGFTLDKEQFWLKRSEKRPQEKGYATWSFDSRQGVSTVRIAPRQLPSQGEAELSFSAQGLSGRGPFSFALKAYKEERDGSVIKFNGEVFRKTSD